MSSGTHIGSRCGPFSTRYATRSPRSPISRTTLSWPANRTVWPILKVMWSSIIAVSSMRAPWLPGRRRADPCARGTGRYYGPVPDLRTMVGSHRKRLGTLVLTFFFVLASGACGSGKSKSGGATGSGDSNKLLQAGLTAQGAGRLDEARQDYLKVIAKDPTNKFAYYDLGVIYQQLNDANDAAASYNKALQIDANYKPALFNLAVLETPLAPQTAISLYQKLLGIDPNDATVHFNLGLLLRQIGQKAPGDAEVSTALRLNPQLSSRLPVTTVPPKS